MLDVKSSVLTLPHIRVKLQFEFYIILHILGQCLQRDRSENLLLLCKKQYKYYKYFYKYCEIKGVTLLLLLTTLPNIDWQSKCFIGTTPFFDSQYTK